MRVRLGWASTSRDATVLRGVRWALHRSTGEVLSSRPPHPLARTHALRSESTPPCSSICAGAARRARSARPPRICVSRPPAPARAAIVGPGWKPWDVLCGLAMIDATEARRTLFRPDGSGGPLDPWRDRGAPLRRGRQGIRFRWLATPGYDPEEGASTSMSADRTTPNLRPARRTSSKSWRTTTIRTPRSCSRSFLRAPGSTGDAARRSARLLPRRGPTPSAPRSGAREGARDPLPRDGRVARPRSDSSPRTCASS
jgi:hypothetical protein